MEQPLISVIIPTYNDASLLPFAIQSICDQTYKNLEILIVDDKSTDNTEKVVKEFIKKDPRIQYFKTPEDDRQRVDWRGVNINAGCFARNYGMKQAKGKWITFQDSDDASILNRIETQLKLAMEYSATCITTSCVKFEDKYAGIYLDADRFLKEEKNFIIFPQEITTIGNRTKGFLMTKWFPHSYIPFTVQKWFPFMKKLFFGTQEGYPGAGNSPFFKREVFEKVSYRKLSDRVWPALSGRGTDRDFLFQVAETFQNSYSFRIPLYLWRVGGNYNPHPNWEKYIKKIAT
ncbi:glycosyltransferase family 2 protein [bacterium]|nr:MAG: glycosyltransferase family 2 protein [bacterium]